MRHASAVSPVSRTVALTAATIVSAALGVPLGPAATRPDSTSSEVQGKTADYLDFPVFYEHFASRYMRPGDIDLLREKRVRLQHYDPVDVSGFEWDQPRGTPPTWSMQMLQMRFLLPLIGSETPGDRELAESWLASWSRAHMARERPWRTWGDPMTSAFRAMVFVFYLKTEQRRPDPDPDVIGMLEDAIRSHQELLTRDDCFDTASNLGMIDAMGLFETTRVLPAEKVKSLAFSRMSVVIERFVSARGVEMEHSPAYHYVLLRWVDEAAEYLGSLPSVPRSMAERLKRTAERMRAAGYFLQDHAGRLPQIGDTDSTHVTTFSPAYRLPSAPDGATTFYDGQAGYAVYKGDAARDCRYVVFRNQEEPIEYPYHVHPDAGAVYFSYAGETILGDPGRYSYGLDGRREYFVSARAHNTVFPRHYLKGPAHIGFLQAARTSSDRSTADAVRWVVQLAGPGFSATRTVTVPPGGHALVVEDTLAPAPPEWAPSQPPKEVALALVWNAGHDVVRVEAEPVARDGARAWTLTSRGGRRFRLTVTPLGTEPSVIEDARVARGENAPYLGWYSPSEMVMRPATAIVVHVRARSSVTIETRIDVVEGACARADDGSPPRGSRSP